MEFKIIAQGTSLVVQWLRLHAPNAGVVAVVHHYIHFYLSCYELFLWFFLHFEERLSTRKCFLLYHLQDPEQHPEIFQVSLQKQNQRLRVYGHI